MFNANVTGRLVVASLTLGLLVLFATACAGAGAPSAGPEGEAKTLAQRALAGERVDKLYPEIGAVEETGVKRGGKLVKAYSFDAPHLDPKYSRVGGLGQHIMGLYNGLVRLAWPTEKGDYLAYVVEGDLAEKWEASKDLKVWTFTLRKGVKWHNMDPVNGREVVADDIKYTYERYQEKDSILQPELAAIEKIEVPDKYTVKITLKQPYPYFLFQIVPTSTKPLLMVPKEAVEKFGDLKKTAVGTGPFMLASYLPKTNIVYKRNPDYFEKAPDGKSYPYLDEYEYIVVIEESQRIAGFRAGQIDILDSGIVSVDTVLQILRTNPDVQIFVRPPTSASSMGTVGIDMRKKPWSDVRVRRAMSLAVDRDGMINTIWKGYGTLMYGWAWPLWTDEPPNVRKMGKWYDYNPTLAKQLLAEAGYPNGFTSPTPAKFYRGYGEPVTAMAEQFQADMAKIGVKFDMQEVDYTTYASIVNNQGYEDIFYGCACPTGYSTAYDFARVQLHSKAPKTLFMGINDPDMDRWIEELALETDPKKQRELQRKIIERDLDMVYRISTVGFTSFQAFQPWVRDYRSGSGGSLPQSHILMRMWSSK